MLVKREREIQAFVPQPYWLVHGTFEAPSRVGYAALWFEGDENHLEHRRPARAEARRGHRHQGLRQGRHGCLGRAQGAVRALAAPLRPHEPPARRQPPLRLRRAPHAPGRAVPVRREEGDHVSAHVLALPLRATSFPSSSRRPRRWFRSPTTRRPRATCSSSTSCRSRVVNDARVDDHHAIIPTDDEHDIDTFSPDERRIFDLIARRFWPSSTRPPATRTRPSSPRSSRRPSARAAR